MRSYRLLIGFLLAVGPGFGIGVVVFLLLNVADWPVVIDGSRREFIRWGIVGAAVGGLVGSVLYPDLREFSQSYKRPGTQKALGLWGLLTWEAGLLGPVLVSAFFAGMVGGIVGGLSGEIIGDNENGAFLGAVTGVLVGTILGVISIFSIISVAYIIRAFVFVCHRCEVR